MRDKARLDSFYNDFKEIHKKFPDWRFGQLIINFQRWCNSVKRIPDIFYLEEDECLTLLKEYSENVDLDIYY